MLPRWSRALSQLSHHGLNHRNGLYSISRQSYANVAVAPATPDSPPPIEPPVNLDKLFWSKPCSLALPLDSPMRINEPQYEGIKRLFFKLMLFYSKQSRSIRGANVVYKRVLSQVDKPAIYEVFNLEWTFKTNYALLVLHMWLCLRRLKQEGKEGVELGQYVYETYNHDVELRVSKAGIKKLCFLEISCSPHLNPNWKKPDEIEPIQPTWSFMQRLRIFPSLSRVSLCTIGSK